jgi:hypothetical protein
MLKQNTILSRSASYTGQENQKSKIRNLKVLYLSVNSSYSHSSLAYEQLRCLSEKYAPEWTWDIVECSINDNINETLRQIRQKEPDLIAATVYLFNRDFVLDVISRHAVLSPETHIVFGGPEFLGSNESILKQYSWISAVFRGDESSFPNYLNLITADKFYSKNLKQIPGICIISENDGYFDGGTARFQDNLDNLPSPYAKGYFDRNIFKPIYSSKSRIEPELEKGFQQPCNKNSLYCKPFIQLETSRGCSSKCSFCTSSLTEKVQYYSLDRVCSDLIYIKNAGIREVRVLDRTFNIPSDRAVKLLKIFSEEFSDIRFHLEFNPSKMKDTVCEQLAKAAPGQFHVEIGIQTFYPPALSAVNRMAAIEKTEKGLKKLISISGIEIHADLLYGLPEQTIESVFNDLKKLILAGPEEIQLEVLKILPGTPIMNYTSLRFSPIPPYDVLSTGNMDINDILQFSYLSKIIDSYYNVKATRNLFQFAVVKDSLFLEKFLLFASKRFAAHHGKPSPSVRFKLLFDFALETDNDLLYSITLFTYFSAGFFQKPKGLLKSIASSNSEAQFQTEKKSSPTYSIELIRKNELRELLKKKLPVLWSNNKPTIDKPAYLASLDCNAGDIWLNPKAAVKKGRYKYLFLLSQGGMNKRVSKILGNIGSRFPS